MLRSEIQKITGLTRKAIEYYEDKGLINPRKLENGYRDYGDRELMILTKISLLRKLGISLTDIERCLPSDENALSSVKKKNNINWRLMKKGKKCLS